METVSASVGEAEVGGARAAPPGLVVWLATRALLTAWDRSDGYEWWRCRWEFRRLEGLLEIIAREALVPAGLVTKVQHGGQLGG